MHETMNIKLYSHFSFCSLLLTQALLCFLQDPLKKSGPSGDEEFLLFRRLFDLLTADSSGFETKLG